MEALTRFLPRAALRVAGCLLALAREATWPVGCEGRWWQVGERGWSASLWASPCLLVLSSQSKGARRQTSTGRWATRGSFAAPSSLLELRREGPGLQGRSGDRHPPGGLVSGLSLLRTPESCWVGGLYLSLFARLEIKN